MFGMVDFATRYVSIWPVPNPSPNPKIYIRLPCSPVPRAYFQIYQKGLVCHAMRSKCAKK